MQEELARNGKMIGLSVPCGKNGLRKYVFGSNFDELIESLRILGDIDFIFLFLEEYHEYLTHKEIGVFKDVLLNSDDASFEDIFKFLSYYDADEDELEEFEDVFIEDGNAHDLYDFMYDNGRANLSRIEDALIKLEDDNNVDQYIYLFATRIVGADIKKLEKAIISIPKKQISTGIRSPRVGMSQAMFAAEVDGADIKKHENFVIKYGCPASICYFAEHVRNSDIEKLENALIERKDASYIYSFARDIYRCNTRKLQNAIIKTEDSCYITLFAKLPKANVRQMWKQIKRSDNKKLKSAFRHDLGLKIIFS